MFWNNINSGLQSVIGIVMTAARDGAKVVEMTCDILKAFCLWLAEGQRVIYHDALEYYLLSKHYSTKVFILCR